VEEHEFVKYVQAVCQDFAKGCNCDVMLCYGDDKKTRVIMRYLDHETSSQHGSCPGVGGVGGGVVRDEIMMFVRLVEKSDAATLSTTVLRAKGEREMNIISVVVVVICLLLFVWFVCCCRIALGFQQTLILHSRPAACIICSRTIVISLVILAMANTTTATTTATARLHLQTH
jgi:hypothetical protein